MLAGCSTPRSASTAPSDLPAVSARDLAECDPFPRAPARVRSGEGIYDGAEMMGYIVRDVRAAYRRCAALNHRKAVILREERS